MKLQGLILLLIINIIFYHFNFLSRRFLMDEHLQRRTFEVGKKIPPLSPEKEGALTFPIFY